MNLKFYRIILRASFLLNLSFTSAFANQSSEDLRQGDAFSQGVVPVVLTKEEKSQLKLYAENSKNTLSFVLEEVKGKTPNEKKTIYKDAIISVVKESYNKKHHNELLMRFILNQALELTLGSRDPTKGIGFRGTLKDAVNTDVTLAIYKDSIELALRYAGDDINAADRGIFSQLPYLEVANSRLHLAKKWFELLFNPHLKFQFLQVVLTHWHTTVTQKTNLKRTKSAYLISELEKTLKEVRKSSDDMASKQRSLWKIMKDITDTSKQNNTFKSKKEHEAYKKLFSKIEAKTLVHYSNYKPYEDFYLKKNSTEEINHPKDTNFLIVAARLCDTNTVEILLAHNPFFIDFGDERGMTALMWASSSEISSSKAMCEKTVEVLLKYNADVNVQDDYEDTALNYAERSDWPRVEKLLKDHGARKKPVCSMYSIGLFFGLCND